MTEPIRKLNLRLPATLYGLVQARANEAGVSLNSYITAALAAAEQPENVRAACEHEPYLGAGLPICYRCGTPLPVHHT